MYNTGASTAVIYLFFLPKRNSKHYNIQTRSFVPFSMAPYFSSIPFGIGVDNDRQENFSNLKLFPNLSLQFSNEAKIAKDGSQIIE